MTLVLLHSAGANAGQWDRVVAELSGVPVLAPSLPGRAGVPWPDGDPDRDVSAYGRFVLSLLDREGVERATVAGHSLGGAIAMWLALEHPGRVAGLGLSSTGARLRVLPHVLDALGDDVRDMLDVLVNAQATPATPDRDRVVVRRMLEATGTQQTHCDLLACDRFDVMDRLESIRVPTQVFAGLADVLTPPKYQQYLAEHVAGARLTTFEGVGHLLPLERAEAVAGELAVLWAATAPRPAPTAAREAASASADSGTRGPAAC